MTIYLFYKYSFNQKGKSKMEQITKSIEGVAKEANLNSDKLLDFLKSFFGSSKLESFVVSYAVDIKLSSIVLQKNIFFNFEYNKKSDKVTVTSVPLKTIDRIYETFDGIEYLCNYYLNDKVIFTTTTDSIDLIRQLRDFTNLILAKK